ncbi:MAG TPA: MarR family transcriptional regulator [Actinomycetota bacterium]|jgi:DNA-binding MarR family transcriptional regulator|nr:MarR family transcriptional regulator [Actinomycetota bacterium]
METDFVDDAVEGWAKQVPKIETSALEITGRLDRIARHLDRRATEAMTDSGLSCRDLEVLGALRRSGCGLPAGQLARAAMLTSGGMTGQADRLASAGLIVRRPDPDDRRTVLVSLTPAGRGAAESALTAYLGAGEQALSVLSDDEQETLAELLRKLLVGLEGPAKKPEVTREQAKPARAKEQKSRFQAE